MAAGLAQYDLASAEATVAELPNEDAGGRFVGATINKLFGKTMVSMPSALSTLPHAVNESD